MLDQTTRAIGRGKAPWQIGAGVDCDRYQAPAGARLKGGVQAPVLAHFLVHILLARAS
jgi:hypothetical protein